MVRIALGQLNTTVGDLEGNVDRLADWSARATAAGADVVCFPELAITGYPPEDLTLRPEFVRDNLEALDELARRTAEGCAVLTGFIDRSERGIHNAAALLRSGSVAAKYRKMKLPNYGVFDERRYFEPGRLGCTVEIGGVRIGLSVCEDAWTPGPPFDEYGRGRAKVILNINGSPYHRGKTSERLDVCAARARETGSWIVYVNAIGGQDELVFDGGSMLVNPDGELVHRATAFTEDLLVVELQDIRGRATWAVATGRVRDPWPEGPEEVYRALALGLRDYVRKNGFHEVVLGLSGGIDSAIVATLAADALGAEAVHALAMPSPYSSPESLEDATLLAGRLGIRLDVIPIDETFRAYLSALEPLFAGTEPGVTEENIQARIRGNLLMALSNKFGGLVLATGNKSEYAVGYSTLYGDMAGGFAPIKDVPKTLVYELAMWRNAQGGGRAADPAAGARQAPVGRAPPEPEGHGLAPALRGARPDRRGLRRGRPRASTRSSRPAPTGRPWSR